MRSVHTSGYNLLPTRLTHKTRHSTRLHNTVDAANKTHGYKV